jgi:glycosyltransferase involved in cell wall biosynthesis
VVPHWYDRINQGIAKADARRELGWPAEARIFFTVRALGPRYGLDVALRAIAPLLAEHDGYFFLGGDGPWRERLKTLGKSLDPGGPGGPRIRFLGRISDRELELAYAAADLFVLPTLALECFGLITLEAFAFGCPVLATDAGAIPESMRPILPDLIVPAGDEQALTIAARKFLQNRCPAPASQVLIDYAASRYGAAVVIPQIYDLLEAPDGARA